MQIMVYNVNDPLVVIFNAIEDLANIASAANLEKLQQQIINYGIKMLKETGEFETSLTTWFDRSPAELTWANFKKHFNQAHANLVKIRGTSPRNTPYYQSHETIYNHTKIFFKIEI